MYNSINKEIREFVELAFSVFSRRQLISKIAIKLAFARPYGIYVHRSLAISTLTKQDELILREKTLNL